MSKFRINLEIQGLKIEIEGSREDAPRIANSLGRQFSGLLAPAVTIVEGEDAGEDPNKTAASAQNVVESGGTRRKARPRRRPTSSGNEQGSVERTPVAIDWRHDVEKFGTPQQSWNTATKGMWLIWVLSKQTPHVELTRYQIAETFNKHFKSAGPIRQDNLQRDFSKEKQKRPPKVSEDSTQEPSLWFLTDAGKKFGQALVTEALGGKAAESEVTASDDQ